MNSNGSTPVLALKGVSKSFGPVQALSNVDFEVQPGEVVALVGDNGAGKSTLVKTIAGIHPADAGTISFEGKEVHDHEPDRRGPSRDRDRLPGPRAVRQPRRGREPLPRARGNRGRGAAPARRGRHGEADRRAAREPRRDDHGRAGRGRHDVRRPAPAGGHRPLAARRAQARDARRADGRARRAPDGHGARPGQAPARPRLRRARDQPQPGGRVRGGGPDLRAAARPEGRRIRHGMPARTRSWPRSRALRGTGDER